MENRFYEKRGDGILKKTFWKNCITTALAFLALVCVWGIAYVLVGNELVLPSFFDCVRKMGELLIKGAFWASYFSTLLRVLIAFLLSLVLALVLAFVSYLLPTFGRFLSPLVSILRSTPTLAVVLILLVWTGAGTAPIVVAVLALFPLLYAGTLGALAQVDSSLLEMSRVYKVPLRKQVLQLYLPSVAPYFLREAGAGLSFGVKLVVSAEVLAMTAKSLGGWLLEAKAYLDMPLLFALVIVGFLTGMILEGLVSILVRAVERGLK